MESLFFKHTQFGIQVDFVFTLSLIQVGYTNAGKSTLLNRLSGADVLAEDRLFATLDPTTRKIEVLLIYIFLQPSKKYVPLEAMWA